MEEITRQFEETIASRQYRNSNGKKNIGRNVILKRAEEASQIINDIFKS